MTASCVGQLRQPVEETLAVGPGGSCISVQRDPPRYIRIGALPVRSLPRTRTGPVYFAKEIHSALDVWVPGGSKGPAEGY